jgi:hypothetical protein
MSGAVVVPNNFPLVLTEQVYRGDVDAYLAQNLTNLDPRDGKDLITGAPENSTEGNRHALTLDVQPPTGFIGPLQPGLNVTLNLDAGARQFPLNRNRDDVLRFNDGVGIGEDWFERIHIFPKSIDLGNVVSNLSVSLDLYSSYRRDAVQLIDIDNQISGQGVSIGGAPSLPKNHAASTSIDLTLDIDQVGPPSIDGDVIFDYDVRDITLPVTGTRVILFPYVPQREMRETLSWKTDVIESADGTEMRISLRKNPRQSVTYNYVMRNQRDLNKARSLFTEWQPRVFGVPLWWWARKVTSDVTTGDSAVQVATIDNADFRVGGLCMVAKTNPNDITEILADVLEIDHLGSPENTLTFTSSVTQDFNVVDGAIAVPVLACVVPSRIDLDRRGTDFYEFRIPFLSTDNTEDLTDLTGFTTYRSKIVMDDPNFLSGRGSYRETLEHKNTRIDEGIGKFEAFSTKLIGVGTLPKRWINNDNATEWQRRGLLYGLRGKQVSFWLPSFQKDMTLIATAASGASTIDIENIGYTNFVNAREPYADIEIVMNDGTIYRHRITGATEVSPGERLTIDPVTSAEIDPANVDRISYLLLQRLNTDDVQIAHRWIDTDGDKKESEIFVTTIGVPDDA